MCLLMYGDYNKTLPANTWLKQILLIKIILMSPHHSLMSTIQSAFMWDSGKYLLKRNLQTPLQRDEVFYCKFIKYISIILGIKQEHWCFSCFASDHKNPHFKVWYSLCYFGNLNITELFISVVKLWTTMQIQMYNYQVTKYISLICVLCAVSVSYRKCTNDNCCLEYKYLWVWSKRPVFHLIYNTLMKLHRRNMQFLSFLSFLITQMHVLPFFPSSFYWYKTCEDNHYIFLLFFWLSIFVFWFTYEMFHII